MGEPAPFALGVTIFGSERKARELVPQLDAGVAMINDVIVPAAHPEVALAARGASGFGATRGAEGLLEMTRPKVVTVSRARRPLHLAAPRERTAPSCSPLTRRRRMAAAGARGCARSRPCSVTFVASVIEGVDVR